MNNIDKYKKYAARKETSPEYWAEGVVVEFTEDLARILNSEEISRAELARRVGHSKAYVTKVFSGQANFTVETMTKFAIAVDHVVRVHLAPVGSTTIFMDSVAETVSINADPDAPVLGAHVVPIWQAKSAPSWRPSSEKDTVNG